MASLTTFSNTSTAENKLFLGWLLLLGVSLSLSLAVANILVALGFVYLLSMHRPLLKSVLKYHVVIALLIAALLFQCIELIHDGWILAKSSKVFLLFTFTFIIGNCLNKINAYWLPWLLSGLVLGLFIGTPLNQYLNPSYPLWATYSMTYANQAACLAITVGLLSFATKKWWVILPMLLSMALYIYMTSERAAIPALGLSGLMLLAILRKYKSLMVLILIISAGAWLYSNESAPSEHIQNVRFDIWQHGLLIAQKDMFLGRGEHHEFNQEELNLYKTYAKGEGKKHLQGVMPTQVGTGYNMSYHNQFIQFLVEYGILGCLMFFILLIFPIVQAWKVSTLDSTQSTFIVLWTAFAVHCIFETAFDAHSAIILGLLAGLMKAFIIPAAPKKLCLTVPEIP